jgi:transcriptional regulator with XRE-family HTH domain
MHSPEPQAPAQPVRARRSTSFDPVVATAFGHVVRVERLDRNIPQDAFALSISIDRSYFGKLERGERQPSLAILLRISRGLGMSGGSLVEKVEDRLKAIENLPSE